MVQNSYNGIVILNKPTGSSSHHMISFARHTLNMKRIGHTGTLDPEASGVLPLLLGNATKASELLAAEDKSYRAVILLGTQTDTLDLSGKVTETRNINVTEEDIFKAAAQFTGEIEQLPPMYSAVQINGQRLYTLARQGIEVERKKRTVNIYSIEIKNIDLPKVEIDVHCSKGTYIRTLASDIGLYLGCGGCIESLVRTKCGMFGIENSVTPEKLSELAEASRLSEIIIPTDRLFSAYEPIILNKKCADRVKNGVPIYYSGRKQGEILRLYDENKNFIALSVISMSDGRDCLKMIKGFY